jgi:hypothetical protein
MKFLITESRIKEAIFDYLESSGLFDDVEEHRTGYPAAVKEFFRKSDGVDDDEPYYDHVFTYYRDPESYEEIVGVPIEQIVVLIGTENGDGQVFVENKSDYVDSLKSYIKKHYDSQR